MKKSFTLTELLVAIGLTSLVSGAILGIFLSGIWAQRRILATQEVLDQASYVLEYMGRQLRLARKDDLDGKSCLHGYKTNCEVSEGGRKISFKNFDGKCHSFYFQDNKIVEKKEDFFNPLPLTSVKINYLKFKVSGETQQDTFQPRITISFEAETKEKNPTKLKFQTTISQRNLDVVY